MEGDILGFIGPNGAGKTTTIKLILGLQNITSGKVYINGYDIEENFKKAIENVGTIVESPDLYMYMSGYENLKLVANLYKNVDKKRIDEIVKLVGLENRIKDKVSKYSLGMRQRLGIAQAILHKPKLLILDEPTNHLDLINKETIESLLNDYKGTLIIVSHDRYLINKVCTKLLVIEKNKTTLYNYGYKEYLEKRVVCDSPKVNKEEKPKKEKKNIDKTNGKKIIEKEINDLEKKVNLLNNELLKSEVYMDQLKSKDILLQIESLNKLIDKKYIDLESIEDCGN